MNSILDKEDGTESEAIVSEALCNSLIIGKIVSFSDFSTLKSLRQLNNLWNSVTNPHFLKCSFVRLHAKIEDLQEFSTSAKNIAIKTLEIYAKEPSHDKEVATLFTQILEFLSPNLETLTIYPPFGPWNSYFSFPPPNISFPKLKKLEVHNYSNLCLVELYPALYTKDHLPNLEELVLCSLGGKESQSFVLEPLFNRSDERRDWTILPKLKALTISQALHADSLLSLVNFPQRWTKLELFWSSGITSQLVEGLEQILEKNKQSLKALKLKEFLGEGSTFQLKFPDCMRNLEKLELEFRDTKLNLCFGRNLGVNYSDNFPNLKKLVIDFTNIKGYMDFENIWGKFFPPQICKSVTCFRLHLYVDYLNWLEYTEKGFFWYKEMFPNARWAKVSQYSAYF